jgi:hypothetical protein
MSYWKCLYQVRVITVLTVFRLLTDFVCLYNYEFGLSLCKIVRSSVILLLPLFIIIFRELCNNQRSRCDIAWLHVANHSYHSFRVKRLNNLTPRVRLFNRINNSENRGINNTCLDCYSDSRNL